MADQEVHRGESCWHQKISHDHPDGGDGDEREDCGGEDDEQERQRQLVCQRDDPLGRLVLAAAYCGRELLCRDEVDDPERKEVQCEGVRSRVKNGKWATRISNVVEPRMASGPPAYRMWLTRLFLSVYILLH